MDLFKLAKVYFPAIVIVLLLITSCAAKKPVSYNDQPQTEANIITNINALPEVVKANALCKKNSHGEKHLITSTAGRPSDSQSFYSLKVAIYPNTANNVLYSFIVYPKTNKIYYLDTKKAKYIPLSVWRRQRNYNALNN